MLQVIDTPGFGDNINRIDFEQEELILKFVKQGVVDLSLVLITIKYGSRLEMSQIETIMNVLRFLGREMKANTGILFTHAENSSLEQREEWLRELKGTNMSNLLRFCERGAFYTGMNVYSNEMDKEVFTKKLRYDHFNIIKTAINSIPIKLTSDENDKVVTQFKIYESAAKDSLTLKKLLPEIPNLGTKIVLLKQKLTTHFENENAKLLLEKYKNIDNEQLKLQCVEWSKLQTAVEDYIEKGSNVQKCANHIRTQYKELMYAINDINNLLFEIELF